MLFQPLGVTGGGVTLRNNAGPPGSAGLDTWVLSGNKDATRHLRMRKARSVAVEAGGVGLRLLHYVALPPKPDLAPEA